MILNQRPRGLSLSGCRIQNARRALREITCTCLVYRNLRYIAIGLSCEHLPGMTRTGAAAGSVCAGAAPVDGVGADSDTLADCVWRNTTEPLLPAVFEDERNSLSQVRPYFVPGSTLTVGSGDLRTPGDEPIPVLFDKGGHCMPTLRSAPNSATRSLSDNLGCPG